MMRGALGTFQVQMRHRPNMTLIQHYAQAMYKRNGTKYYMRTVSAKVLKWVRKKAHMIDSSELEKKQRQDQAKVDRHVSDHNRERRRVMGASKERCYLCQN